MHLGTWLRTWTERPAPPAPVCPCRTTRLEVTTYTDMIGSRTSWLCTVCGRAWTEPIPPFREIFR